MGMLEVERCRQMPFHAGANTTPPPTRQVRPRR
jgi:hypothetical protein